MVEGEDDIGFSAYYQTLFYITVYSVEIPVCKHQARER